MSAKGALDLAHEIYNGVTRIKLIKKTVEDNLKSADNLRIKIKKRLREGFDAEEELREGIVKRVKAAFAPSKVSAQRNVRTKRRRTKRKGIMPRRRRRRISTGMPASQLVKLHSYHYVTLDPAVNGAVAIGKININNPLDPITNQATMSITSTEHHPIYWDVYEKLYNNFEVISVKVNLTFLNQGDQQDNAIFVLPVATDELAEALVLCADTFTFHTRLHEAYPRARVKYQTATGEEASRATLMSKVNIRDLENNADQVDLIGVTLASGSAAAPNRTPELLFGIGSLLDTNLTLTNVIIKIEQIILFSQRTGDIEGVAIA